MIVGEPLNLTAEVNSLRKYARSSQALDDVRITFLQCQFSELFVYVFLFFFYFRYIYIYIYGLVDTHMLSIHPNRMLVCMQSHTCSYLGGLSHSTQGPHRPGGGAFTFPREDHG